MPSREISSCFVQAIGDHRTVQAGLGNSFGVDVALRGLEAKELAKKKVLACILWLAYGTGYPVQLSIQNAFYRYKEDGGWYDEDKP